MTKAGKSDEPTPEQAAKAARIFGAINLVLGSYMILGGIARLADINFLPNFAATMAVGVLGFITIVVAWGTAAASGLGLVLLTQWGRKLAVLWGKVIVWLLPISFGLSHGLSEFISIAFAIIIVICLYANVLAQNLAKPEFDVAFER